MSGIGLLFTTGIVNSVVDCKGSTLLELAYGISSFLANDKQKDALAFIVLDALATGCDTIRSAIKHAASYPQFSQ